MPTRSSIWPVSRKALPKTCRIKARKDGAGMVGVVWGCSWKTIRYGTPQKGECRCRNMEDKRFEANELIT